GLAAGDVVLRAPTSNLKDGQKVDMPNARVASANGAGAGAGAVQGK
ncbi:MAG: efflux transporter periplasmic adaptor subunit, partial [Oxalobacteraceae bacterium]